MVAFWRLQKDTVLRPLPGKRWRRQVAALCITLALVGIAWPVFYWVRSNTVWAEYFGQNIYPVITAFFSRFWGIFPFSAAEFLLYGSILGGCAWLAAVVVRIIRKGHALYRLSAFLLSLGIIACSVWVSFCYGWGILYQREPLANRLGLTVRASSTEELADLCAALIAETNTLRETLPEDDAGCFAPEVETQTLLASLPALYTGLEGLYFLGGEGWCRPKSVALSRQMSKTEIVGIYIWLTTEPNVDTDIPITNLAFNALHEIAHQRGYAREDEANYLAYLACMHSEDDIVRYSGLFSALVHAMNKLYENDRTLYIALRETYCDGPDRDMARETDYWAPYKDTVVSQKAEAQNNAYLKANQQTDGTKSYGRMVDLLLAEYRARLAETP